MAVSRLVPLLEFNRSNPAASIKQVFRPHLPMLAASFKPSGHGDYMP